MSKFNCEQAEYMVEQYNSVNSEEDQTRVVKELAEHFSVSTRSIIGKLVREGVYEAKTAKNVNARVDKEEYVRAIRIMLGARSDSLTSLSGMSGKDLVVMAQCIINLSNQQEST